MCCLYKGRAYVLFVQGEGICVVCSYVAHTVS